MSVNIFQGGKLVKVAGQITDAIPLINNFLTNQSGVGAADANTVYMLKNELDKRKVQTYNSYTQLGFTSAPTTAELYNALPPHSIFLGYASNDISDYPQNDVTIELLKISNNRGYVRCFGKTSGNWEMRLNATGGLTGVWVNLNNQVDSTVLRLKNVGTGRYDNVISYSKSETADYGLSIGNYSIDDLKRSEIVLNDDGLKILKTQRANTNDSWQSVGNYEIINFTKSNIPSTLLTPISTKVAFTNPDSYFSYSVKNGICVLDIWSMSILETCNIEIIVQNIPKPAGGRPISQPLYNSSFGFIAMMFVGGAGVLRCNTNADAIGKNGYATIVYPVE